MSNNPKRFKIILIDDEHGYYESIKNLALQKYFKITHHTNLDDGLKELESDSSIFGVILDAQCFISENDETPKDEFIAEALVRIEQLKQRKDRQFTTVINTAYFEKFSGFFNSQAKVFKKGENDELFKYLRDEINQLENTKLIKKYDDVFSVFENKYLSSDDQDALLELLKKMGFKDLKTIEGNLAATRRLLDNIFRKLNEIDKKMAPDNFFEKGNVFVRRIFKHFQGNWDGRRTTSKIYLSRDDPIYKLFDFVYSLSSDFGSHKNLEKTSNYTVRSVIFALMELIIWLKIKIEKN